MARRGGATAFGVTTGVTTLEDWTRQSGKGRPHRVLSQIRDLLTSGALPGSGDGR
jgi:hypothetical protein